MNLTLLLADAAQTDASGKTHALGLGWTHTTSPMTQPMALVALVDVDSDLLPLAYALRFDLLDADLRPVLGPSAAGGLAPIHVAGEGRAERTIQPTASGEHSTLSLIVTLGPIALDPQLYYWRATFAPEGHEAITGTVRFAVRPAVAPTAGASR